MDAEAAGSKERSPRYAQPVPVGAAEPLEAEAEEATEDEDPPVPLRKHMGVLSHATPDQQQFKNMCGHKCSPGVENKCLRHGKAAAWKTSVAYVQKQSNLLLFFAQ